MSVLERTLRHPRYRDHGKRHLTAYERTAIRAGLLVAAGMVVAVTAVILYYEQRRLETCDAVERCAATRSEFGDEFFLDKATVLAEIDALGGPEEASHRLLGYLRNCRSQARHRWVAVAMLGRCHREAAWVVPQLRQIVFNTRADRLERAAASLAVGRIGGPEALECLTLAVRNRDIYVRDYAIKALCRMNEPGVEDALLLACADPDYWIRLVAAGSLGRVGTTRSLEMLEDLNKYDMSLLVRAAAYEAHGKITGRCTKALARKD